MPDNPFLSDDSSLPDDSSLSKQPAGTENHTPPTQQGDAPERLRKGIYRHFKGQYYQVIDVAQHCDTEEFMVVYRALYGERGLWVRPLTHFVEYVEREGTLTPRFQWMAPD